MLHIKVHKLKDLTPCSLDYITYVEYHYYTRVFLLTCKALQRISSMVLYIFCWQYIRRSFMLTWASLCGHSRDCNFIGNTRLQPSNNGITSTSIHSLCLYLSPASSTTARLLICDDVALNESSSLYWVQWDPADIHGSTIQAIHFHIAWCNTWSWGRGIIE